MLGPITVQVALPHELQLRVEALHCSAIIDHHHLLLPLKRRAVRPLLQAEHQTLHRRSEHKAGRIAGKDRRSERLPQTLPVVIAIGRPRRPTSALLSRNTSFTSFGFGHVSFSRSSLSMVHSCSFPSGVTERISGDMVSCGYPRESNSVYHKWMSD